MSPPEPYTETRVLGGGGCWGGYEVLRVGRSQRESVRSPLLLHSVRTQAETTIRGPGRGSQTLNVPGP